MLLLAGGLLQENGIVTNRNRINIFIFTGDIIFFIKDKPGNSMRRSQFMTASRFAEISFAEISFADLLRGVLHIKQCCSLRSLALVFSPLFPSKLEKTSK